MPRCHQNPRPQVLTSRCFSGRPGHYWVASFPATLRSSLWVPGPHFSPAFCALFTLLHPQEAYESAKQRAAEAAEGAKATAGELGGSAERAARQAAGTTEGAAREAGGAAREGLAGAEGAVKEAGEKMEVRRVQ